MQQLARFHRLSPAAYFVCLSICLSDCCGCKLVLLHLKIYWAGQYNRQKCNTHIRFNAERMAQVITWAKACEMAVEMDLSAVLKAAELALDTDVTLPAAPARNVKQSCTSANMLH